MDRSGGAKSPNTARLTVLGLAFTVVKNASSVVISPLSLRSR